MNGDILGSGVFNADGDIWKFHRGITRPFFSRDRISDFDVLNKDVRMDNFLVWEPFLTSSPLGSSRHEDPDLAIVEDAVVLIDLAQCRLRHEARSEVHVELVESKTSGQGGALRAWHTHHRCTLE